MKNLLPIVISILAFSNLSSQGFINNAFRTIKTYENVGRKLPLIEKYYIRTEETADAKLTHNGVELNLELSQINELSSPDGKIFVNLISNKDNEIIMTVVDSIDVNNRLIKSSTTFPKSAFMNEIRENSYTPEGKILSYTTKKCKDCKTDVSFTANVSSDGTLVGFDVNSMLGKMNIVKKQNNNKIEYFQYTQLTEEAIEAFKLAGKKLDSDKSLSAYAYQILMEKTDSIVRYEYDHVNSKMKLSSIEIVSKTGKILELLRYSTETELSDHYKANYDEKDRLLNVDDLLKKTHFSSKFDSKGNYVEEYSLDYNIDRTDYIYDAQGRIESTFKYEEPDGKPSEIILITYK